MKKLMAVFFAALMLVACTACAGNQNGQEETAEADTITITDHGDNEVTLPAQIDKIAVADIFTVTFRAFCFL